MVKRLLINSANIVCRTQNKNRDTAGSRTAIDKPSNEAYYHPSNAKGGFRGGLMLYSGQAYCFHFTISKTVIVVKSIKMLKP